MSGSAATSGATGAVGGAAAGSVAGPVGTIVGGVIGGGIGIYGAIKSANDQADIDRQKAALEEAQAQEIDRREVLNDSLLKASSFKAQADFSSMSAASGHAGGGIGSQLEIARQTNLQIQLNDEAALFQEKMIRAGAGMENQLASNTESAGYLNAASQGATLLGRLASPQAGIIPYGGGGSLPAPAAFPGSSGMSGYQYNSSNFGVFK